MKVKKILKNVDFWIMALPIILGFFLPIEIKKNTIFLLTWQFFFPLTMMTSYFLIIFFEEREKKQTTLEKLLPLLPATLLGIEIALLFSQRQVDLSPFKLVTAVFSFIMIWIGNWLPKIEQNQTLGIRTTWTLENRDNWNYTNRVCGKVWFLGGLVLLFLQFFFNEKWSFILSLFLIILLCVAPIWISWRYAQKQKKENTWIQESKVSSSTLRKFFFMIAMGSLGLFIFLILILGKFNVSLSSDLLVVEATFERNMALPLEEIEAIHLISTPKDEKRWGYQSLSLQMGEFYNQEFGNYRRYTWNSSPISIQIHSQKEILVINQESEEKTQQLYDKLRQKIKKSERKVQL